MAKIVVGFTKVDTSSGLNEATTAAVELIVKDHPTNVDRHLRLIGLLANSALVLSDDDGKFTVTVQEKEK